MDKLNKGQIEDLDFEISFYEELIKDKPDFIDALILLGDAYTKRGFYQKGLDIDKQLVRLMPYDPIVNYNLACSYSLLGDIDRSFETLKDALKKGYRDLDFMNKDPDLANVRKDKRFKSLLTKLKKERGGIINGVWFIKEEEKKATEEERGCKGQDRKKAKATQGQGSKRKKARRSCPKG